ncbi:MAG: prenyltransferase/squalene oxidase repeat-containing protein [Thermogutta sp.]
MDEKFPNPDNSKPLQSQPEVSSSQKPPVGASVPPNAEKKSLPAEGQTPAASQQKPTASRKTAKTVKAKSSQTTVTSSAQTATQPIDKGSPQQEIQAEEDRRRTGVTALLAEILHWMPSWFVSMVVHAVALLVMAMITIPGPLQDAVQQLVVAPGQNEQLEEIEELLTEAPEDINLATDLSPVEVASNIDSSQDISPFNDDTAAMASFELDPIGLEHAPQTDLLASVGALSGDAFSGRGSGKERMVRTAGGSEGSERAVALALKWLADHQMPDGGWSFEHQKAGGCNGQCRNPGNLPDARSAATALALLPFLGAGQTHREGQYAKNVRAGLYYLITNRMKISAEGGSFLEKGGNMYSHGLASIVLCEAYGMTHDKVLAAPAQQAINFICNAQDPIGGGWRYEPRQKGDTSVVGWQLMALKSGVMSYLQVPKVTISKAQSFLDSVQANDGATYGYLDPGNGPATTAVGLLCRMYLGWDKNHPGLQKGIRQLSNWGPSTNTTGPGKNNFYYNYYATQVMRHWEGEEWKNWNSVMRDYLIKTQAQKGHETGSWFFEDSSDHGKERGGRLYFTAMATLILEVYYRHMPLYRKQATAENFPLD